jgi:hypothetical protein
MVSIIHLSFLQIIRIETLEVGCTTEIPATREAEIRRIGVQDQPGQKFSETPS